MHGIPKVKESEDVIKKRQQKSKQYKELSVKLLK